jgi:hypothetical protein
MFSNASEGVTVLCPLHGKGRMPLVEHLEDWSELFPHRADASDGIVTISKRTTRHVV